jgi:hypothetical protein
MQLELRLDRLGALKEQGHGLILRQRHQIGQVLGVGHAERRHGKLLLSSHAKHLPTRHQHLELGASGQQIDELGGCLHDLFKVVKHQQQVLGLQFPLHVF